MSSPLRFCLFIVFFAALMYAQLERVADHGSRVRTGSGNNLSLSPTRSEGHWAGAVAETETQNAKRFISAVEGLGAQNEWPSSPRSDGGLTQSSQTITSQFFGIHIWQLADGWPYQRFTTIRSIGAFLNWNEIQTGCNPNTYNWSVLDPFVQRATLYGADVIFTVFLVPPCASSNPTDTSCYGTQFGDGGCDHPIDLNCDGTGTDQYFISFLQAVAQRYGTQIKYYEVWNEPDVPGEWSIANCSSTPNAKWLMLARMAKDMRSTVQAINPSAQIISASVSGGTTAKAEFKAALAMAPYSDILGFHGRQNPPELDLSLVNADLAAAAAAGYGTKPLWDTEFSWSKNIDPILDNNNRAAQAARLYLIQSFGVERAIWFGDDYSNSGQYWSSTLDSTRGCTTAAMNLPATSGGTSVPGFYCPAAPAYAQVHSWMLNNTVNKPICSQSPSLSTNECSSNPPLGLWKVRIGVNMAIWDNSLTCSSGVCNTESVSTTYKRYTDLNGNVGNISGGTVDVSLKPILLHN
jgi:hypothetical protein